MMKFFRNKFRCNRCKF